MIDDLQLHWKFTFAVSFITYTFLQWYSMTFLSAKLWWGIVTQSTSWYFSTVTRFITHWPHSAITPGPMYCEKDWRNEEWQRAWDIKFRSLLNLYEITVYPIIAQHIMVYMLTNQLLGKTNLFLEYIRC